MVELNGKRLEDALPGPKGRLLFAYVTLSQIPQLAQQLGVHIDTLRIFGPDHIILAVVEADDIDSVRTFALQSRLMQWNTVKINATYSIEEAVAMIDDVEAIF